MQNSSIYYYYWVGQKVHLGFSVTAYRKTQKNFLFNPIYVKKMQTVNNSIYQAYP